MERVDGIGSADDQTQGPRRDREPELQTYPVRFA